MPGVGPGQRYGVPGRRRVGPRAGLRHNPAKLLLDPYARAIEGEVPWGPGVYGHVVDDGLRGDGDPRSDRDSAADMPRCVVVDDDVRLGRRPPAGRVAQRDA